jgi:hypothetical protein
VPAHWEGDLILGLASLTIGTLVERKTRFTILLHLPRMAGYGDDARVKSNLLNWFRTAGFKKLARSSAHCCPTRSDNIGGSVFAMTISLNITRKAKEQATLS